MKMIKISRRFRTQQEYALYRTIAASRARANTSLVKRICFQGDTSPTGRTHLTISTYIYIIYPSQNAKTAGQDRVELDAYLNCRVIWGVNPSGTSYEIRRSC